MTGSIGTTTVGDVSIYARCMLILRAQEDAKMISRAELIELRRRGREAAARIRKRLDRMRWSHVRP